MVMHVAIKQYICHVTFVSCEMGQYVNVCCADDVTVTTVIAHTVQQQCCAWVNSTNGTVVVSAVQ